MNFLARHCGVVFNSMMSANGQELWSEQIECADDQQNDVECKPDGRRKRERVAGEVNEYEVNEYEVN